MSRKKLFLSKDSRHLSAGRCERCSRRRPPGPSSLRFATVCSSFRVGVCVVDGVSFSLVRPRSTSLGPDVSDNAHRALARDRNHVHRARSMAARKRDSKLLENVQHRDGISPGLANRGNVARERDSEPESVFFRVTSTWGDLTWTIRD